MSKKRYQIIQENGGITLGHMNIYISNNIFRDPKITGIEKITYLMAVIMSITHPEGFTTEEISNSFEIDRNIAEKGCAELLKWEIIKAL